jgi:hypothetical protein
MSQPAVQAEALCGWTDSMPAFGIEPDEALARAGLDNGDVATSNRISLKRFARMAESVGERANHPAATWTIGLNYDLAQLGRSAPRSPRHRRSARPCAALPIISNCSRIDHAGLSGQGRDGNGQLPHPRSRHLAAPP